MSTIACAKESKTFRPLHQEDDNEQLFDANGTAYVTFVQSNALRRGGNCMIDGHPCKIKDMSWACPGKHGSAKLRVVGSGLLDEKKRETIFRSSNPVAVPVVHKLCEIPCLVKGSNGFSPKETTAEMMPCNLPSVLGEIENATKFDGYALVSLIVTCGCYRITNVEMVENLPESVSSNTFTSPEEHVASMVCSKKEARKRRKALLKHSQHTK